MLTLCRMSFLHFNQLSCLLEPLPTIFFKTFFSFFKDGLLSVVNCSLQMGVFPTKLKTAVVKPTKKK